MQEFMLKYLYWAVPLIIITVQANYTLHSFNQIRFEEILDIRSVYWFSHGYVHNGVMSFVSWYGFCALIYKIFGFSLYSAKFIKIALVAISLFCLAAFLKRIFGDKAAVLPLLAFGLSPSFIYFNMLSISHGIDLLLLPVCLYLFSKIDFKNFRKSLVFNFFFWVLLMLIWIAYPTLVFFIPMCVILYFYSLVTTVKINKLILVKNVVFVLSSFLLPLILLFLYTKNRELLIADPDARGSGFFRGTGVINPDFAIFWRNIKYLFENLFVDSYGYYYEVIHVEFSKFFPIITVVTVLVISYILLVKKSKNDIKFRKIRLVILLLFFTIIFNVITSGFTDVLSAGLRRYTPTIASFYALYAISWYYICRKFNHNLYTYKILLIIFLLVPLHHLLSYPENLHYLNYKSPYSEGTPFNLNSSPRQAAESLVDYVQKQDLNISCADEIYKNNRNTCRYAEIFSVVAGYCEWNRLHCHSITGYDPDTGKNILLTVEGYKSNEFLRN